MGEVCACEKKTGRENEAMPAASLMALEEGVSLGKEAAVRGAAVKDVWK